MRIKKISGTAMLNGNIIDSLDGDSTYNAPSVHAVNERFTYSTTEQVIGTWIDGKPIYRNVIEINVQIAKLELGIPFLGVDNIINMYGCVGTGTNERWNVGYMNPLLKDDQVFMAKYQPNTSSIRYYSGITGYGYIIIEYTKTADTTS